jgi:hypothetical protein
MFNLKHFSSKYFTWGYFLKSNPTAIAGCIKHSVFIKYSVCCNESQTSFAQVTERQSYFIKASENQSYYANNKAKAKVSVTAIAASPYLIKAVIQTCNHD